MLVWFLIFVECIYVCRRMCTAKNDTIDPNSLMLSPNLCLLLERGKQ